MSIVFIWPDASDAFISATNIGVKTRGYFSSTVENSTPALTCAVQAALTGHLVLSTLHTNDAPSAVTRLLNIGVEPYLVAASVEAILAQRLVRKICTHCKEPYDPPMNIRRAVEKAVGGVDEFYHGAGCNKCRKTGFAGRIGIYELLVMNDEIRDRISANAPINELRKITRGNGMVTLYQDGMAKLKAGLTTVEEVFRVTAG